VNIEATDGSHDKTTITKQVNSCKQYTRKTLRLELQTQVLLQRALRPDELNVGTILDDALVLLQLLVLLLVDIGEAPLLGDDDLLTAGELVAGTTKSLLNDRGVGVFASYGQQDLTNVDTSDGTVRFTPSTTHAGLKPISTGAGQHLVYPDDVEGVYSDSHVEGILSRSLCDVFVAANTGSFERLARELFILVRNEVSAEGKVVNRGTFTTQVKDSDLGIGNTTIIAGFRVRLVFTVAVAASGTTTHLEVS